MLAAWLALRGVPWIGRALIGQRTHLLEQQATLMRARNAVETASAARESLAVTLRSVLALAPRLVDGRTAAEAAAALSGHLSFVAGQSRIRVTALNPVSDSTTGTFHSVAARLTAEGDVSGLTTLLLRLERGEPLLTVRDLAVQATSPTTGTARPERLRFELTVAGWYLPRETP